VALQHVVRSTVIDAPIERVWAVLRDFNSHHLWHDVVAESRIEGDERSVALSVDDRGPGIPAELADRIFEPFVSGRPRKGERGGYGLGLAICRSIMQQHGGSLHFESRGGGGTRFLARFPRPAA